MTSRIKQIRDSQRNSVKSAFLQKHRNDYFTDDDFVRHVVTVDADLAGACAFVSMLRRVVATLCEVAPEKLHPSTSISMIQELFFEVCRRYSRKDKKRGHAIRGMVSHDMWNLLGVPCPALEAISGLVQRVILDNKDRAVRGDSLGAMCHDALSLFLDESQPVNKTSFIGKVFHPWSNVTKRMRKVRAEFIASRANTYVSSVQFVTPICNRLSPEERCVAVFLRRVVADECGVAPELIAPTIRMEQIRGVISPSGEKNLFVEEEIEALTGRWVELVVSELPDLFDLSPWDRHETIADWICAASEEMGILLHRISLVLVVGYK